LAEHAVQTYKSAIKKQKEGSLEARILKFLFNYRITPHSTTGISPASLLMNRQPKSKLDLVLPNLNKRVTDWQNKQKQQHDKHAKDRSFDSGDPVLFKNFGGSPTWVRGKVVEVTGPVSYKVSLDRDGMVCRRHQDQLRKSTAATSTVLDEHQMDGDFCFPFAVDNDEGFSNNDSIDQEPQPLRRSTRVRRAPDKLTL